jgi:hypothetical protein
MSKQNAGDLEMMQYKEDEVGEVHESELQNLSGRKGPVKTRIYKTMESVSNFAILIALIIGIVVLISVTSATFEKVKKLNNNGSVTTVYSSLGLPGFEAYSWEDVTTKTEAIHKLFLFLLFVSMTMLLISGHFCQLLYVVW